MDHGPSGKEITSDDGLGLGYCAKVRKRRFADAAFCGSKKAPVAMAGKEDGDADQG
jgi:hypothetical protein